MAEFYVSLSANEMSRQIATMINKYNRWYMNFSAMSIRLSTACYFVEVEGDRVVGCASYVPEYENITKVQHVCVLPTHRGRGIAKKLVTLAINNCPTEYVCMTIREDNLPSIRMAESLEFRYVNKHWFRDHMTLTFGRRTDHGRSNEPGSVQSQVHLH
jgi:RimJ/RimL family protein N-acetyltransferase